MGLLDTLKLVDAPRRHVMTPEAKMRDKVISGLLMQKEIIKAEREGRVFMVNQRRYVTQDGARVETNRTKQPRKWFWRDSAGTTFMQVSYCNAPVILANGQKVIEVGDLDSIDTVIDTLVAAVNAGELDAALKTNQKPKAQKVTAPKKVTAKA